MNDVGPKCLDDDLADGVLLTLALNEDGWGCITVLILRPQPRMPTPTKRPNACLLGAGASVPLGMPTAVQLRAACAMTLQTGDWQLKSMARPRGGCGMARTPSASKC